MARPAPRELEVVRSRYLSPHMLRVTLGGAEMATFPAEQESAYIKLLFPQGGGDRPLMRTYTVSRQRADEIDVDFALHDNPGPASRWAAAAGTGDRIQVGGPGPRKLINPDADWFLLAGDMTALPAITANVSRLPAQARGYVVIEVPGEDDIQVLGHPEGVELQWLVNPVPDPAGRPLPERVRQLPWLPGQPAVWAACEFNSMRALRRYFKQERQLPKSHVYISSYWKIGNSEDEHKRVKQEDTRTAGEVPA